MDRGNEADGMGGTEQIDVGVYANLAINSTEFFFFCNLFMFLLYSFQCVFKFRRQQHI